MPDQRAVVRFGWSEAQVSFLSAAGLAVGALIAVPLGPWVEFCSKHPVRIRSNLIRFAALMSVPAAHLFGALFPGTSPVA